MTATPAPLPEGLLVELATPLTPTGALDEGGLVRLVDRVASRVAAVVAGAPGVGEGLELPYAVRLQLFRVICKNLPEELPLFFGITGATPEETQTFSQQVEEEFRRLPTSRPVYWVDLPLWWHSNRGLPKVYLDMGRSLSRPLVLMNHPHLIRGKARPLKHGNIRTSVFKKLTALPGVAALIYRGEMRRFLHYYTAMADRPEFMLYEADERRFLTRPGARGLISAGAQLFPVVWGQVVKACLFPEEMAAAGSQPGLIWEKSNLLLQLEELYRLHPAPLLKLGLCHLGVFDFPTPWPSTPSCPAHLGERFLEFMDGVTAKLKDV